MGDTLARRRFSALATLTLVSALGCSDTTQPTTESQIAAPATVLASITSGTGVSSPITSRLPGAPCIDVANESRAAGTQVQIWNCYGSSAQTFSWMADGTIRAYASTTPMCLTSMGTGQDGDRIQIQACHGSVQQKWTATSAGEIRGLNGKCLDVFNENPTNGTKLVLWSCHGGSNQKWDNSTGSGTTPPSAAPSPTVASVVVTLAASSLQVGQTTQATAVARDGSGAAISGASSTWSSSNSAVATVSTSGLVTAVAAGSASITAASSGKTGSQVLSVSSPPPPAGIAILPGESIQAKVDANPVGTTFILKSGTHARQTVVPKDGNVFRGEAGTVLDGQNATQFAFRGHNGARWVNNVTVRNLAITKYAPPAQNGAIWGGDDQAASTTGWTLDSLEVSYNANLGVRIGNRMRVLRSTLHHNGTVNIGGIGRAVLVDGVESSYGNNGCVNNPGFESGGSKFVKTDSLVVRNSFFHNNCGVGLWLDIENINYTLENNRVEDNVREGICIEVSYKGVIRNNSVSRNGWPNDPYRPNGWLWDAGIGIHASPDVEVYGNTLNENFQGIVIIQQPRNVTTGDPYAPPGGFIAQNIYIHDNIIYQRVAGGDGSAGGGAVTDISDTAIFTSRNNRWARNTYYVGTNTRAFAWMNGWRTAAEWRAYGNDVTGSFNP
jgi:parallel beta-helix repeat protein